MPKPPDTRTAIARGLDYLRRQQSGDGGFVSFSSPHPKRFNQTLPRHTTFVPALILAALSGLSESVALSIRERLADFIDCQKSSAGSFNYWAVTAPERQKLPYPDDLDDTFCALIGLYLHDPKRISEAVLAQTVKLLLATETAVGGPYRTWLVASDSQPVWLDVDVAVNANVAYFLALVSNRLASLDGYLSQAIRKQSLASPYYPRVYPLLYYTARVCPPAQRNRLLQYITKAQHAEDVTSLELALCLTARLRLGDQQDSNHMVRRLLASQRPAGQWSASVFCADPIQHGRPLYQGSAALTTALAIEALQLYQDSLAEAAETRHPSAGQAAGRDHTELLVKAGEDIAGLAPELRLTMLEGLRNLADSRTGAEVLDLPWQFSQSLNAGLAPPGDDFLDRLSLANLYGWLAYGIYDDFLDDSGQPRRLPVANVAMRYSLASFSEVLPSHRPYQLLVRQIFDSIDGAGAWELAHCRFRRRGKHIMVAELPDYGDLRLLAERSFGHAIPPLAVLSAAGIDDASTDFTAVRQALTHYLIARQLNDDLHDWPEDLQNGQISYVVKQLLASGLGSTPGNYVLAELLTQARQYFWHEGLPDICQDIRQQIALGRRSLRAVKVLKRHNVLSALFDGLAASVDDTLSQQRQAQRFLQQYTESSLAG